MTILTQGSAVGRRERVVRLGRRLVGGLFLVGGGVHVGVVAADAEAYRGFGEMPGVLAPIRTAWRDVFMAHPSALGLAVAAGELAIGVAILVGGPWARWGLAGAIAFHVALLLFGLWPWSVPMLVVLALLLRAERPRP